MITTHVMDMTRGLAAAGVTVILEMRQMSDWVPIARGTTDEQGWVKALTEGLPLLPGTYSLTFDIGTYQRDQGLSTPFFPEARITFNIRDTDDDYHLPLLLSPYGYSAFRGA
jgi:5-hydroxyisourate hydrolase